MMNNQMETTRKLSDGKIRAMKSKIEAIKSFLFILEARGDVASLDSVLSQVLSLAGFSQKGDQ